MDDEAFWQIIERVASGDGATDRTPEPDEATARYERLVVELEKLDGAAILAFHRAFAKRVHEAYRFELMAVSNIVNGSRAGEDFDKFVGWLVMQGRSYFEAALTQASRAAARATPGAAKDDTLWRAPAAAYRARTGNDDFELEAQPISLVMEGERLTTPQVKERFADLLDRFPDP